MDERREFRDGPCNGNVNDLDGKAQTERNTMKHTTQRIAIAGMIAAFAFGTVALGDLAPLPGGPGWPNGAYPGSLRWVFDEGGGKRSPEAETESPDTVEESWQEAKRKAEEERLEKETAAIRKVLDRTSMAGLQAALVELAPGGEAEAKAYMEALRRDREEKARAGTITPRESHQLVELRRLAEEGDGPAE